ncbi:putative toxin-antitoxin system toxin component, PIN family [Bacteroides sp. 519]|uniref:putative toxin-antitoxin system toxin component, PIN family n=1 Tax=Bacteroides sp. 519 TaxID=2302937 RepID=UPI0013CFCC8C|nr:putative toxin-antitoxin system toxin component, PIN family [Bacteroides sp. 519]NDV57426.1 putative toxin-antitoxin system toxin component, PIN family [Bacteroides sp. 519]
MKIIVDTNLWISFLIGKKLSIMRQLLSDKKLTIYICDTLINEFKDVSSRDKIKKYVSEKDVADTLQLMESFCKQIDIRKKASSPIRDIKDLYLLSLADTIPADYIITGDKDLLVLQEHNQTKILTYQEFLEIKGSVR